MGNKCTKQTIHLGQVIFDEIEKRNDREMLLHILKIWSSYETLDKASKLQLKISTQKIIVSNGGYLNLADIHPALGEVKE